MRAIHAVLAGLLLGGVGWWAMGHPGYVTHDQRVARAEAAAKASEPRLYRWRDANGVLQITDTPPPAGRKAERVEMREDLNVVPMSPPEDATTDDAKPR
jgi:hypothetical protein